MEEWLAGVSDEVENRRRHPRVETKLPVTLRPQGRGHVRGTVTNVSREGAFLVTPEKMGTRTDVLIYLPLTIQNKKRMCPILGQIVRIDRQQNGMASGYGIKFDDDIDPSSKRLVYKFVTYEITGSLPSLEEESSSYEIRVASRRDRSISTPGKRPVRPRKKRIPALVWVYAAGFLVIAGIVLFSWLSGRAAQRKSALLESELSPSHPNLLALRRPIHSDLDPRFMFR